jgi:hypothetical protein
MRVIQGIKIPDWVQVPEGYVKLLRTGAREFSPYYIIVDPEFSASYNLHLAERYPHLTLFMFAKRGDNDTIATFSKDAPGKVILINDFSTKGYELDGEFESFWDWFDIMIKDFKELDI